MEKDIKKPIIQLCEEYGQRPVRGTKALNCIKAFLKRTGYSTRDIKTLWLQPEKMLGPFDELPQSFRESLANSAHFHIQELNLLTSAILLNLAYGPVFKAGGSLVHQGRKAMEGRLPWIGFKLIRSGKLLIFTGRRIMLAGRLLASAFLKLFRFTGLYKAPLLHMLWHYTDLNPSDLIQNYIKNIPVDPRLSPVFKCSKRHVMSCGLLGFDLLPSRGKLHFLESNVNPGHYIERHRLFPEGDTLCVNLANWAVEQGFRTIVFYPNNFGPSFDKELEEAWQEIVRKKNLRLEIVDNPGSGSPWPRRRDLFMDCGAEDTLYVNGRSLESPLTRLIARKGLMENEIRCFNKNVLREKRIPIPGQISSNDEVPPAAAASRFPNIIIKNAILDMAEGITMVKADRLPDNATTWPNIAYEYVVPDLIVKDNQGRTEEFVSIFRAYMLITPDGPVYVGTRKDVSATPVPQSLAFGEVTHQTPYITNLYLGDYSVPHNELEDRACKDAILSIGEVVFNFLKDKNNLIINF